MFIEKNVDYAVLFPGQGSQFKGMSQGFENSKYFKEILPVANEICDIDFYELMQEDKQNILDKTQYTQPALLISSYVLWLHFCDYLEKNNIKKPKFLAGHSLGEYSALVASKSLDIKDAITLVYNRGIFMQESIGDVSGAMAAILGLDNEKVLSLVNDFKLSNKNKEHVVEIANYNAIGQVVVSGLKDSINEFVVYAKNNGAKIATLLPVSVAAHSSLMQNAANKLKNLLDNTKFSLPKIPVYSNVTALVHSNNINDLQEKLYLQMTNSVRWVEIIQDIKKNNINNVFEIGVNNVLTKLNKRIESSLISCSIDNIKDLECI